MKKLPDKLPFVDPLQPGVYGRILQAAAEERERRQGTIEAARRAALLKKIEWMRNCKQIDSVRYPGDEPTEPSEAQ
jgi:hypothetical protein